MKANTVQKISFLTTKGRHVAAIINNSISIVRREGATPLYNLYYNVAKGDKIETTEGLENEFKNAYFEILEAERQREEAKKRAEAEAEHKRIAEIKENVKGMTPKDVAEFYNIDVVETASHWSDLYEGRSSFAFQIRTHEENEIIEIASEVNNWCGEFGELKNRAGEHHHNFVSYYDLKNYQELCERHFNNNYFLRTKESEAGFYFEQIKEKIKDEEITDIEEIIEITKKWENLEEGFYDGGGYLILENVDFKDFFGYGYDVYGYCFGYELPSKDIYYYGIEEEDEDEDE